MIATITINPAIDRIYEIDHFELNQYYTLNSNQCVSLAGGKGLNVSFMLKRLGLNSIAMGFVGGNSGRKVIQELLLAGITVNFVRTDMGTRTNVFVIDKTNDTMTEIGEMGRAISEEDISCFMERYTKLLNQVNQVVIAGALLPEMNPSFYYELVRLAKSKGVKTILHTAPIYLEPALAALPDIVFPDLRHDAVFMGRELGTQFDCESVGIDILLKYPQIQAVLFTQLLEDIVAVTAEHVYAFRRGQPLYKAHGLGFRDAVVTGISYAFNEQKTLETALRFGVASGFVNMAKSHKNYCCLDEIRVLSEQLLVEIKTR